MNNETTNNEMDNTKMNNETMNNELMNETMERITRHSDGKLNDAQRATLATLKAGDIEKAYSGKARRCMCGCAGNYYYGAAGDDHENVNVAQVTRVLNVLKRNVDVVEQQDGYIAHAIIGNRSYVVYLKHAWLAGEAN